MVVEVFVMCDGANDSNGKLNILGAFDTIVSRHFPFAHPHCSLALRLRYSLTDPAESRIKLVIQGVTGEPVLAKIDTTVTPGPSPNPTSTANLIVNLNALHFENPGDYLIILHVDGTPTAITPIYVRSSQGSNAH